MTLDERILDAIKATPGQKAKDIAAQLGVDKQLVNSALYGQLKASLQQDKAYRWYLKGAAGINEREEEGTKQLDTPLARLCRYYLDCLSRDDVGGVSEFASSKYGQPNYVELTSLPMLSETEADPFDSEGGRWLLGKVRRDRNRQAVFLGYPVHLSLIRSRKSNWEGFKVEPLFLFSVQEADSLYTKPMLGDTQPQINFQALRSLSNAGETYLMEEAIQLAEELGLNSMPSEQPDLDELFVRLREIRADWDWQEDTNPYSLSSGVSLSDLNKQGIYNRAILVAAERSPYTKGLESELGMLQSVEESKYRGTALGLWLTKQTIKSPPADQQALLEVLPLNSEQRQAVRQALSNPLTVITGPPGTGKSQVVTSILVNAAWQGKTVLFASKNNKAVDVVETRVNSLGPRPVLLRLGAKKYQAQLADYLVSLLATTATTDDHERYHECEAIHGKLQQQSDALDAAFRSVVELRNEVDALEQRVEQARRDMGEEIFRRARSIDREELEQKTAHIRRAIDQTDRAKQGFLTRFFWPLIRNRRFGRLAAAVEPFQKTAQQLGLAMPEDASDFMTVSEWVRFGDRLAGRVTEIVEAQAYFTKLSALTEGRSIEDLSRSRKELRTRKEKDSDVMRYWDQSCSSSLGRPRVAEAGLLSSGRWIS